MSSIQETNLKAIADAIRAKEKSTGVIQASKFAERIAAIQTGAELSIVVASTAGSTATAVKGDITVTGTVEEDGTCTLIVPEPGTWTVTCTKDGNSASEDVVVNATYPVDIVIISVPKNWTPITLPSTATTPMKSIAYGNGKFVCFDDSNTQVPFYSSDGVNWTKSSLPTTTRDRYYDCVSVFYFNDRFIAVGRTGGSYGAIFYSLDGVTWRRSGLSVDTSIYSACYGNGKYVVMGDGTCFFYSTNGTSWTAGTMPGANIENWYVAFGNERFVAVRNISSDGGSTQAAYSEDGVNWTEVELPIASEWNAIAFGNGKFVIKDWYNNHRILYSEDGVNWTQATVPSSGITKNFHYLFYVNGLFMITTYNNELLYSKDGVSWSVSPDTLPGKLIDIAYGDSKYVASMGETIYTA